MPRKYGPDSPVEWADYGVSPIKGLCPYIVETGGLEEDRGCPYCIVGDTPVLMADMTWTNMTDVQVGSDVMALKKRFDGAVTYQLATVTAKLQRNSEVVEIVTQDGSTVCTPSHRWRTREGVWKHASELKEDDAITFISCPVKPPIEDDDYKRGYLRGIIMGDGTMGVYNITQKPFLRRQMIIPKRKNGQMQVRWYSIPERTYDVYKFRLTMKDRVALRRAEVYLAHFGIPVFWHIHMGLPSIRKDGFDSYKRIANAIGWNPRKESFLCGYLAGIFDAEGSFAEPGASIRIGNSDPRVLRDLYQSLEHFGFLYSSYQQRNGVITITLNGGIREKVRFFATTKPSIERKRDLTGFHVGMEQHSHHTIVTNIRNLKSRAPVYDIETTIGSFIADGMVAHNCYMKPLFNRFKNSKRPLNQTIRCDIKDMYWIPPKSSKIAVCLNLDLFHLSVPDEWKRQVIAWSGRFAGLHNSTYIYLTKCPQEYSKFRFPTNSWLGTTWDGLEYTKGNIQFLANVETQCLKFVSFEPLLVRPPEGILDPFKGQIKWVIIGFDSRRGIEKPPLWWVIELKEQAYRNEMAVWVKDNIGYYASATTKEHPTPI